VVTNFKEWLWSAKVLTTMVWILFPLVYIITIIILVLPSPDYRNGGNATFLDILLGPLIIRVPTVVAGAIHIGNIYFPPISFMVGLFLFSIYPAMYPTEKFFKRRGNASAVIEYQYIRKILGAFLIAEIIIIITLYFLGPLSNDQLLKEQNLREQLSNLNKQEMPNQSEQLVNASEKIRAFNLTKSIRETQNQLLTLEDQFHMFQPFWFLGWGVRSLYTIVFVLPVVPIFILFKLLLEHARKQFTFYYAKICFEIINEAERETDKAGFLSWGLEWYNKVVKRATKLYVMNMEAVYSMIISRSPLNNNQILNSVLNSFHNGDEFKPLRYMLTVLSDGKQENVLVKETLASKIKESSGLIIPIVTVIITIISTFFLKP
jgi:hypothetical protein